MERSLFSRDFLSLIGKGEDAPAPAPEQRRDEMEEDEENLTLALSLSLGTERKGEELPRSSSAAALTTPAEVPAPPALPRTSSVAVQAEEHAPRPPASESPSSASLEGDGQRLQGTVMSINSVPAVIEAAGNNEYKKRKEEQSLKRLDIKKKMVERRNSTCSTSKEAAGQVQEAMNAQTGKSVSCLEAVVGNNENPSNGMDVAKWGRGCPPKYQATLTSQHSLSQAGKKPNAAFKGTAVTMEPSSSSSVPSSNIAIRSVTAPSPLPPSSFNLRTAAPTLGSLPPSSFAPRTAAAAILDSLPPSTSAPRRAAAATLGSSLPPPSSAPRRAATATLSSLPPPSFASRTTATTPGSSSRGDQSIYSGTAAAAALRENGRWDDVGRRLMLEMPAVYTKDLRSGNKVNGFLSKYKAGEVKIVCICHGSFFTPPEFVEHAGAGNGEIDHPLRHIVVSPPPTR